MVNSRSIIWLVVWVVFFEARLCLGIDLDQTRLVLGCLHSFHIGDGFRVRFAEAVRGRCGETSWS